MEQKSIEEKKYIEVIWYGRGGQGAITASQLVAEAAYIQNYKGITTAPSFGAERRGAPVAAFLRLSSEPIRIFSQVSHPDIVVVLDPTLIDALDLPSKFNHNIKVIINSTKTPDELKLNMFKEVAVADITRVALENNLTMAGVAILNTPILGAFVKATNLVSMESIKQAIEKKFSAEKAKLNFHTAELIYHSTVIYSNIKV
jgi:2-oxoacid:acceptor oxidoreductase gamma subunit (pyruvate/2-ketoisovalerate family)